MVEFDSPPSPPLPRINTPAEGLGRFVPEIPDGEAGVCNDSNYRLIGIYDDKNPDGGSPQRSTTQAWIITLCPIYPRFGMQRSRASTRPTDHSRFILGPLKY